MILWWQYQSLAKIYSNAFYRWEENAWVDFLLNKGLKIKMRQDLLFLFFFQYADSLRSIHTRGFASGSICTTSTHNLPRELAPKYLTSLISWSIFCSREWITPMKGGALLLERAPGAKLRSKTLVMFQCSFVTFFFLQLSAKARGKPTWGGFHVDPWRQFTFGFIECSLWFFRLQ